MLPKLWPPRYGHPPAAERAWFLSRERCSCLILLILVIIGKRFPLILPDPRGLRPQAPNLLNARRAQTVQSSVPVAPRHHDAVPSRHSTTSNRVWEKQNEKITVGADHASPRRSDCRLQHHGRHG